MSAILQVAARLQWNPWNGGIAIGEYTLGVDIGGTNTVVGLFDEQLVLCGKSVIPTTRANGREWSSDPHEYLDSLTEDILRLLRQQGTDARLVRAGIGVPGSVDPVRGIVLGASNLRWSGVSLAAEMTRRLGVPVSIDNDVRIYTIGEAAAGAAQGYRHVLCLTLGTGLAAGILVDGKLLRGSGWYAGELGHDAVDGERTLCNCGRIGCLETVASASGIARLAREAVASGMETTLQQLGESVNAADVWAAAMNGDQASTDIFRFVGTTLGRKLLTAVYLLNPEIVVIGGGVAAAGELLLGPMRDAIHERYSGRPKPIITAGLLGDTAGLIGAVHYAASTEHKKGETDYESDVVA